MIRTLRIQRKPRARSITERKKLAQEIRNELFQYKRLASNEGYSIEALGRIHSKWQLLLAMEGAAEEIFY